MLAGMWECLSRCYGDDKTSTVPSTYCNGKVPVKLVVLEVPLPTSEEGLVAGVASRRDPLQLHGEPNKKAPQARDFGIQNSSVQTTNSETEYSLDD